jgi:hypothetical protein
MPAMSSERRADVLVKPALSRWNQPCFVAGSAGVSVTSVEDCGIGAAVSSADSTGAGGGGASERRKRPSRPRDLPEVSLTVPTWGREARRATVCHRTR